MRSLEQIVAEGKVAAANRDQIAAAGKAAKDAAERAELGKHWKLAENKVRELGKEYVVAKAKVADAPKLTLEQMEQRLVGFNVAVAAVERAAALNQRNKTLDQLAREMRRECSRFEAEIKARKEAE